MFNSIDEALEALRAGEMIVVVDDEDRENEGDLLMAAEMATPEAVNFMASHGRGLICAPMTHEALARLEIGSMVPCNTDPHQTAFTVSVDAVDTTTGISAGERAHTLNRLSDPAAEGNAFRRPGHIFPLAARAGGVLVRPGHTEAAVDLTRLAGLTPAGVICEILKPDGTMARLPELRVFAETHGLKLITIADLVAYRLQHDQVIQRAAETSLPTRHGTYRMVGYENSLTGEHHVALVYGSPASETPVLVRVHSECLTGDVFGSFRCDCGEQLDRALEQIAREGSGVLVYLRQEGRGIGLINKIRAYALQDEGLDTVEANLALGFASDRRDYGVGAAILRDLGVRSLRIMTNNPGKIAGLEGFGLNVVERVPLEPTVHEANRRYLSTKAERMGHLILSEAPGSDGRSDGLHR